MNFSNLSDADKNYIVNQLLKRISGIADKKYQECVWINAIGPECDSFDETVCHFIDDGEPVIKAYQEYHISDKEYLALKRLYEGLTKFLDSSPPSLESEFINTSEWNNIVEMAKEVLEIFD